MRLQTIMSKAEHVGKSYLPWPAIQAVVKEQRASIEAINAALPCVPYTVVTPKILEMVSGSKWPENIVSSKLFKLYAAIMFHACANEDGKHQGPLFERVIEQLKDDQKSAFNKLCEDETKFMLEYLNAYERAILKYLRLLKCGGDNKDDKITECILQMNEETLKQCDFEQLLTKKIITENSQELEVERKTEAELSKMVEDALKISE